MSASGLQNKDPALCRFSLGNAGLVIQRPGGKDASLKPSKVEALAHAAARMGVVRDRAKMRSSISQLRQRRNQELRLVFERMGEPAR